MSLLDDFARNCVIMTRVQTPDGAGGSTTVWSEGETFTAHQARDSSMEARRAEKEGVTSLYSALVEKAVNINYGDYFKDTETGTTYRVTSIPSEKEAPVSSSFDLKFFTAERKELPT